MNHFVFQHPHGQGILHPPVSNMLWFKWFTMHRLSFVPSVRFSLLRLLRVSLGQEVVRMSGIKDRTDRITKVHMNQLLLSDSCLIINFLCFSLSWWVPLPIASAIVWLSGIERRIMSEGTQFFFGPLAWCFQTLELIALFPPHWPCLQWCFFSVHHFHKQSRVIIES